MVLIRNYKLHPTRNDVEWEGPRTKAPKTWGPDYHGPAGPAKRPRIDGSFGEPMRPWRGSGEPRVRPPYTRPLRPPNYVRPANRLFNALQRARRVTAAIRNTRFVRLAAQASRFATAAGRAAFLAAEGLTAAEAAAVLAIPVATYGAYRAGRAVKKSLDERRKRRGLTPGAPSTSGNKRPDRDEYSRPDGAGPPKRPRPPMQPTAPGKPGRKPPPWNRPGRPVHRHPGWMPLDQDNVSDTDAYAPDDHDPPDEDDPFDPEDPDLPEHPDIPGPGTDWSGNPGAHNTHALRNGDSASCTRSAARFRSSSVRVTSPSHVGQLPLRNARGCPRSARFQRSIAALASQTRYAQRRDAPALNAAPQAPCASTARRCQWVPA